MMDILAIVILAVCFWGIFAWIPALGMGFALFLVSSLLTWDDNRSIAAFHAGVSIGLIACMIPALFAAYMIVERL